MKKITLVILISIAMSSCILLLDSYMSLKNGDKSTKTTIRLYSSPWPGFMLIELANKMGYFSEEGIEIEYVDANTVPEMYGMLKRDELDASVEVVADLYSKTYRDKVPSVQVVLLTDYSKGADAILKRKNAPLLNSATLKTFAGVEDYSFFVPYALEKVGANKDSIKYELITDDEEKVNRLISGKIDYTVTYEPYLTKAVKSGAEIVYSSADVPGVILDGLVFNTKFINEHPDKVYGFIRAYFKAYRTWKSSPTETYKLVSDFTKTKAEDIPAMMKKIEMLDLDDNVDSMSNKQGLVSVYNNLQEASFYETKSHIYNGLKIEDMVYPDAIRKFKREQNSNF